MTNISWFAASHGKKKTVDVCHNNSQGDEHEVFYLLSSFTDKYISIELDEPTKLNFRRCNFARTVFYVLNIKRAGRMTQRRPLRPTSFFNFALNQFKDFNQFNPDTMRHWCSHAGMRFKHISVQFTGPAVRLML